MSTDRAASLLMGTPNEPNATAARSAAAHPQQVSSQNDAGSMELATVSTVAIVQWSAVENDPTQHSGLHF
jgi:hypothetical protein